MRRGWCDAGTHLENRAEHALQPNLAQAVILAVVRPALRAALAVAQLVLRLLARARFVVGRQLACNDCRRAPAPRRPQGSKTLVFSWQLLVVQASVRHPEALRGPQVTSSVLWQCRTVQYS